MPKPSPYPKDLRITWYRLVDAGRRSVRDVCQTFGIPKKTFSKWRSRDFGLGDPRYRSRRPHPALKLIPEVRALIEAEKLRTNYGPRKMAVWLTRRRGLRVSRPSSTASTANEGSSGIPRDGSRGISR